MCDSPENFEVVIVGAGPGGIAAAVTAAQAGRRVCLIDDAPFAGGQIWRNRGDGAVPKAAQYWLHRLTAMPVNRFCSARLVATPSADTLLIETPDGPHRLRWQSLILATGARELFLPFPGWTLPGVFGAGGLQALVKQGLPVKGKKIVLAGSGPLLLAVAGLMKSKGAIVPLILEQAPSSSINQFARSLLSSPSKLLAAIALRGKLFSTRYALDSYPLAVTSGSIGLSLKYRNENQDRLIDCDYLGCGFHLIPNNEIARMFRCELDNGFVKIDRHCRTTVDRIFAIGELSGIGGVEKAIIEGQIAAYSATGNESAADRLSPTHASTLDFSRRLNTTFRLRPELCKLALPQTVVCRCEDVTLGELNGTFNSRDAKLQTRCGMGPCQARVCGPILQHLMNAEPPQLRPPIFPTTIRTLAALSH